MEFEKAYSFLFKKLEDELPGYLHYHNASHTKDVIEASIRLAQSENIVGDDLILLKTAALFHDAGYIETYSGHEEISVQMAQKWLPQFGYNTDQVETISKMILATKLSNSASNKLEEIICDADLYYLGSSNYEKTANNLYRELKEAGFVKDRHEWYKHQLKFLLEHKYYTVSAQMDLNKGLQQSINDLKRGSIKKIHKKPFSWPSLIQDTLLILLGVASSAFALKGFLVPNKFFDGGITGISLLIHEIYDFNLAYVILFANIPFIIFSIYLVNWEYALKTLLCILLLGAFLLYMPYPLITSDTLLVSIFGGFFLGAGIGLIMRAGSAIDGIEILALFTGKRTSFTISEIILGINIIIFVFAAFSFGVEKALYSMLTYFAASKTIDYVVEGLEAYIGVTIISAKSEIIKDRLVNEMGRGITIYKGERGFLPGQFGMHTDVDIIFTVITRLEIRKLKNLVDEVDPHSFVFANLIKEAAGGIIKRRHIH